MNTWSVSPYIRALGGYPTHVWRYGSFGGVARWHVGGRKEIRQFHVEGGRLVLRRRSGMAPLYNIEAVMSRPLVLVVEGEKAADAAQVILPCWAVTTSMGGSNAPLKTEWAPLGGKRVTIWPDNDRPGQRYADVVAFQAIAVGATTVGIVDLPTWLPDGFDLGDPIPVDLDVVNLLLTAIEYRSDAAATLRGRMP